jgi:hypothetical protein
MSSASTAQVTSSSGAKIMKNNSSFYYVHNLSNTLQTSVVPVKPQVVMMEEEESVIEARWCKAKQIFDNDANITQTAFLPCHLRALPKF